MILSLGNYFDHTADKPDIRIENVAKGLGSVTRFGGQLHHWWTVIHHSLVLDDIVATLWFGITPAQRLYVLMHDAMECVLQDNPRPLKTESRRAQEKQVQALIEGALGISDIIYPVDEEFREFVKRCDGLETHAEAYVFMADMEGVDEGLMEYAGLTPRDKIHPIFFREILDVYSYIVSGDSFFANSPEQVGFISRFNDYKNAALSS